MSVLRPGAVARGAFALRLARRESRHALRRVGVYAAAITLGVAALVAIDSFGRDVARSLDRQARVLMGADARIGGNRPLPDTLRRVVDSLEAAGARSSTVTTALSMVRAPRSDRVRLLQLRAVEGAWPYHGEVVTEPAGLWGAHREAGRALVDPAVLVQLGVEVGDTVRIGSEALRVDGVVERVPTEIGFQAAVGPRIWIAGGTLERAGLLTTGSLARHETYLELPEARDAGTIWSRYAELWSATGVRFTTAGEQARELTDALDLMARYLGLVGLGALLLGGVGVASAIHVYVKERLASVAVLRCLGARQWTVFQAYLLQAAALGVAGALAGVGLGVGVQHLLPAALAGALPVEVESRVAWAVVARGMGIGAAVALLFALSPLMAVREVPPLRALRQDVEPGGAGLDPWRVGAYLLLAGAVAGLAVVEAPSVGDGLYFAAGLAGVTAALRAVARVVIAVARRAVPRGAPYTLRQGVSNLFRPRNQTVAVTLALGFGVFVVATILHVQSSLAARLTLSAEEGRPNVLLFDVQPDQVEGVLALLPAHARRSAEVTPIVPARLASVGRRGSQEGDAEGWALRREYRHTYRDSLTASEEVVAGRWHGDAPPSGAGGVARISVEVELAGDLDIGVGDTLVWDVSGRPIPSVVTSLRRVAWERFATNFFVVFEEGHLEAAPGTAVVLARVVGNGVRATFQRELAEAWPNVSVLDLQRVQEAVDAILSRVDAATRFLALFSALAGLVVLAGSLTASRHQRVREGALLRTLGARRRQVVRILLAEYVAPGVVATATGLLLATAAAGLLVRHLFEMPFAPSGLAAGALWIGVTLLTVVVGLLGSRGVVSRPPLPVLRESEG